MSRQDTRYKLFTDNCKISYELLRPSGSYGLQGKELALLTVGS